MSTRVCKCGCGTEMPSSNKWEYMRGHKPKTSKRLGGPSNALAKREALIVIEQPDEQEPESVNCDITVPQLDVIYSLLQPRQKAVAVLTGLDQEAE